MADDGERKAWARTLGRIEPGTQITFRFDGKIVGRDTYLRINSAAHAAFGPGRYLIRKPRGSTAIWVLHLPAHYAGEEANGDG